jgi:Transposase, Mutator family
MCRETGKRASIRSWCPRVRRVFDDKILSLSARGMTTREIPGHLEEMYQVEVSPALISNVTDAVIEEVKAWQTRPRRATLHIPFLPIYMPAAYGNLCASALLRAASQTKRRRIADAKGQCRGRELWIPFTLRPA